MHGGHDPVADLSHGAVGQLDHVKMVDHEPRVGQVLAHRCPVGAAHVDRHHLHPGPPPGCARGQPAAGVGSGTTGHLPEQAMLAGQVQKPVCHRSATHTRCPVSGSRR